MNNFKNILEGLIESSTTFKKGDIVNWKNKQGGMDDEGVISSIKNDKAKVRDEKRVHTVKLSDLKISKNPRTGVDR